ncbi:MAG: OFA family MFS transporter [Acidobacteria bacterium]|nr:OFA family MFS transporter [Acidobacteriota bacterium]
MNATEKTPNRWLIAIMGTLLMVCLGTVYAWSFFQKPLMAKYGWSNSEVMWAFNLAICFLGLAAAWGGINLAKFGPTKLAVSGGVLFGLGYLLGGFALSQQSLPMLLVGYGVIGGCGLGLGYVTPVATASKWFPDKQGLVTGMVVMGFGFGALVMSKLLAPEFMKMTGGNLVQVFYYLGALFLVLCILFAAFIKNPPAGYVPKGYTPPGGAAKAAAAASDEHPLSKYLSSPKFLMMWIVFFCNICAGIAIISLQSPMMQDILKKTDAALTPEALAAAGATLIAISALFNGVGRFLWGGLSDKLGRANVFRLLLLTQIVAFIIMVFTGNPWIFGALVCYVLLCYGGGFGTMPSFVKDVYGAKLMPKVYGVILTAWSAAGVVGPQIFAMIKDKFADKASMYSFYTGAAFLALGLLIALFLNDKHLTFSAEEKK